MTTETPQTARAADPLPRLIRRAFDAGRAMPPRDEMIELDKLLREEIERLIPIVQRQADHLPHRTREWYARTNAIDAAEDTMTFQMGTGPTAAALHVAELARRALELRRVGGVES
jgi:hypothetical protein